MADFADDWQENLQKNIEARIIKVIKEYISGIVKDRYILQSLIHKDLQLKYKRSVLGVGWSILTPLGLVLIIGSVYSILFSTPATEFIPLLFAGLNPWIFMSASADAGTTALIAAEGYLKQTPVSPQIFPIRVVTVAFINLLYSIATFFVVYLLIRPEAFGWRMLMVIPGLAVVFTFSLAMANITSIINLKVRDYQPLQVLMFQGLFYATPIIYKPSMLQEKGFSMIYEINPFYYMLEIVRHPMIGDTLPPARIYWIALSMSVLLFLLSILLMMKNRKRISMYL